MSDKYLHNKTKNTGCLLEDAQGNPMQISSRGKLYVKFMNSHVSEMDALFSKNVRTNLLCVDDLAKNGFYPNFKTLQIENEQGQCVGKLTKKGPYYWLSSKYLITPNPSQQHSVNNVASKKYSLDYIHRLFGHVNVKSLRKSIKTGAIAGVHVDKVDWSNIEKFQCEVCMMGKSTKGRHIMHSRLKYQQEYGPFQFLHTDLFGPVSVAAVGVPRYILAFTDEFTRYKWVFPLRDKDSQSITDRFIELLRFINTQLGIKVLSFQMDQGTEFTNKTITKFFREHGIVPRYTTVGDSRSNGVAERTNLLLLNDCRTLLNSVRLPEELWFYAIQFATIMRNSIITSSTNEAPRARAGLTGLDASTVLPFGQPVIVNKPKTSSKLHTRGMKGYALCPSSVSFGYLIYVPGHEPSVIDTRHYRAIHSNVDVRENILDPIIDYAEGREINDRSVGIQESEHVNEPSINYDPRIIPNRTTRPGGITHPPEPRPRAVLNVDPSLLHKSRTTTPDTNKEMPPNRSSSHTLLQNRKSL